MTACGALGGSAESGLERGPHCGAALSDFSTSPVTWSTRRSAASRARAFSGPVTAGGAHLLREAVIGLERPGKIAGIDTGLHPPKCGRRRVGVAFARLADRHQRARIGPELSTRSPSAGASSLALIARAAAANSACSALRVGTPSAARACSGARSVSAGSAAATAASSVSNGAPRSIADFSAETATARAAVSRAPTPPIWASTGASRSSRAAIFADTPSSPSSTRVVSVACPLVSWARVSACVAVWPCSAVTLS
jgi:hypothetical protein